MICDNNRNPAKPLILPRGASIKFGKFEQGFGARMSINDNHFHRCYEPHRVRDVGCLTAFHCFRTPDEATLLHLASFEKGWLLDLSHQPGQARQHETAGWRRPLAQFLADRLVLAPFVVPEGAPATYAWRAGKTRAGEAYFLRPDALDDAFWEDWGALVEETARQLDGGFLGARHRRRD
jgi:hypothetical protein